jgi:predicted TIM-barrel fold metal-dependent hydrolase
VRFKVRVGDGKVNVPGSGWLISVDDHVLEPPNVWTDRLPRNLRERGPHIVDSDGREAWVYEGDAFPTNGLSAAAGSKKEEFTPEPVSYRDMRPGCYDPVARIEDMDRAGILASLCFPSLPRFCGQLFWEANDKKLALLCVRAYNDWMIEEWCGSAPGRFIPLTIIPLWDPSEAAREIERCASKGARSFAFSENPVSLGLPSIHDPSRYWDPVFAAAQDTDMVIGIHVGSSSTLPVVSEGAPFVANLAYGASRTAASMLSWLFSGYFQRLPRLRVTLSEGEIGWIPYFLERAEQVLDKQKFWATRGFNYSGGLDAGQAVGAVEWGVDLMNLNIRQDYLDHIYGCFIDDIHGLNNLDVIGENNVMIETDYPHTDSTWPDSYRLAGERVAHLTEEVQNKILRGNAERVFHFVPADIPPAT